MNPFKKYFCKLQLFRRSSGFQFDHYRFIEHQDMEHYQCLRNLKRSINGWNNS